MPIEHFLSFPFCFYSFFEFLTTSRPPNGAKGVDLSFIVELAQFKKRIFCELEELEHDLESKHFSFLPEGDCFSKCSSDLHVDEHHGDVEDGEHGVDVVFAAWNLFTKYIGRPSASKSTISVSKEVVLQIEDSLGPLYERQHFLFSQRRYLTKHRLLERMMENITKITDLMKESDFETNIDSDFEIDIDSDPLHRANAVRSPDAVRSLNPLESQKSFKYPSIRSVVDRGKLQFNGYHSVSTRNDEEYSPSPMDTNSATNSESANGVNGQFDIEDIWALIEGHHSDKIPIKKNDLKLLSAVFDDAENAIWKILKEQFERFQTESDHYLLCRRKLRWKDKVTESRNGGNDWDYAQFSKVVLLILLFISDSGTSCCCCYCSLQGFHSKFFERSSVQQQQQQLLHSIYI